METCSTCANYFKTNIDSGKCQINILKVWDVQSRVSVSILMPVKSYYLCVKWIRK